jgi:hypothetical protein
VIDIFERLRKDYPNHIGHKKKVSLVKLDHRDGFFLAKSRHSGFRFLLKLTSFPNPKNTMSDQLNSQQLADCQDFLPYDGLERSRAVQAICIPLNFLMFSVVILRTCFPTKRSLALRVILVHFAAKTLQHQLLYPSAICPLLPFNDDFETSALL